MEYGYMIKTIKEDGTTRDGFKYKLEEGALIRPKKWDETPICGNGIHGLIHDTKRHYIEDHGLWIILKYVKGEEVVAGDNKIKVPRCWVVKWGQAREIQSLFGKLTGRPYVYDYAVQTAGDRSTQTAGHGSTQTAGDGSTQTAGYYSTQIAGYKSKQTAGDWSIQTAGENSTQTAGNWSTQTAGEGSTSIINGRIGYCKHTGKVLQVFRLLDYETSEYVLLSRMIKDNKKHKLEAVKKNSKWTLTDTIIEEDEET